MHAGVIDVKMYELLLRADLVIADISTANPNAIYELGVRHALRPHSTILMKEQEGKFHFDLNHLATLQYRHLGEDIGFNEARTKSEELMKLIRAVLAQPAIDSPVFTHLAALGLRPMSDADLKRSANAAESAADTLAAAVNAGRSAAAASNHPEAAAHFQRALELQTKPPQGSANAPLPDPFIVQQLALATYKAELPDPVGALRKAWDIIKKLSPAESTDPETLGIAGAIQKRLWIKLQQPEYLDEAIHLYRRGFELKSDYYNGENYALCLDLRAGTPGEVSDEDSVYDRMTARKVRSRVQAILATAVADPASAERSDFKWMLATMANVLYALGQDHDGAQYERRFRGLAPPPAGWEIETFESGKDHARSLAATPSAQHGKNAG
jgi:tetratricopeptide (TPR) repeat protein